MNKDFQSAYMDAFAVSRKCLPGQGVGWLDALRSRAIERFGEAGFPTPRDEMWKFTNLRPLTRQTFTLAPRRENSVTLEDLSPHLPDGLACYRMVFVDGHYRADLDRKSTRLNSSHVVSSYAGFCVKKKKKCKAACNNRARICVRVRMLV